mgnify:CR=1 FL=1
MNGYSPVMKGSSKFWIHYIIELIFSSNFFVRDISLSIKETLHKIPCLSTENCTDPPKAGSAISVTTTDVKDSEWMKTEAGQSSHRTRAAPFLSGANCMACISHNWQIVLLKINKYISFWSYKMILFWVILKHCGMVSNVWIFMPKIGTFDNQRKYFILNFIKRDFFLVILKHCDMVSKKSHFITSKWNIFFGFFDILKCILSLFGMKIRTFNHITVFENH